MDEPMQQGSEGAEPELVEGTDRAGSRVQPQLLRPVAKLRSPILEHRRSEAPVPRPDRPSLDIPPLGPLIGPLMWAIAPAGLTLVRFGWQPALAAGALVFVSRELGRRLGRSNASFGDGFLPYRPDDGWPRGVQEDDDVHWDWTRVRTVGAGGGSVD